MKLYLIRHGETRGNREHRYVGRTDEELLPDAKLRLSMYEMPEVKKVYVSPMKRCRQTAEILFPQKEHITEPAFLECDFGDFEYCNYNELNGNPDYQKWMDTFGKSGFPGGEDRDSFQERCVQGLERILEAEWKHHASLAMVVHGGTLMAALDHYSFPHRDYYEWQAKNAEGFAARVERNDSGRFYFTEIAAI